MSTEAFFDSGFENADAYADIEGLITSLDVQNQHPAFRPIHEAFYQQLKIKPDDLMLEIGCGLGDTSRGMADVTNHQGVVVAIDKSAHLLHEAAKRTDLDRYQIEYRQGDVMQLDFEPDTFSFAHAERVLMHVPSPERALSEMTRVLKAGGKMVVSEPDLLSAKILPDFEQVGLEVMNQWCSFTESPGIGSQLLDYFYALPVKDIQVCVNPIIISSYQEMNEIRSFDKLFDAIVGGDVLPEANVSHYKKILKAADQQGRFLYYVNMYTVTAIKV